MGFTKEEVEFFVNHVVLPPKLPGTLERDLEHFQTRLLRFVCEMWPLYYQHCTPEQRANLSVISSMFNVWKKASCDNSFPVADLTREILDMRTGDGISLYIRAQNAGVIIRMTAADAIIECFEISPLSQNVITCNGRLRRSFPSRAVSLPITLLKDETFVAELALFLHRLDRESVGIAQASTKKAGSTVVEERDTADPILVSELLMSILAANGCPVQQPQQIDKNMRDDVCWLDAKIPWRRSPAWSVIRVSLQLTMSRVCPESGGNPYKDFITFLIARLVDLSVAHKFPSHIIQVVNAKLARRLEKMGRSITRSVRTVILKSMQHGYDYIQQSWQGIQLQDKRLIEPLNIANIQHGTILELPSSSRHLAEAMNRSGSERNIKKSNPKFATRLKSEMQHLPHPSCFDVRDPTFILLDFESWVGHDLKHLPATSPNCIALGKLLKAYMEVALERYSGLPEQLSIMVLTIIELWAAIDITVCRFLPLMESFTPEIPVDFLQPLLLPHFSQMERLSVIEERLISRHRESKATNPSHFSDPCPSSFSVQHAQCSTLHQELREEIEMRASAKREGKKDEWLSKIELYERLQQLAKGTEHTCDRGAERGQGHRNSCSRCLLDIDTSVITIETHEWPLPEDPVFCKAAVFELQCPPTYGTWRDVTWVIVQNLGGREPLAPARSFGEILSYEPLKAWRSDIGNKITLGSITKSFTKTHYCRVRMPAPLDRVLLNNGLQFRMYDLVSGCFISKQRDIPNVGSLCLSDLPDGPYSNLQFAVDSTNHSSNDVIAKQGECSPELSIHEFYIFGTLRAGERLQYLNILLGLSSSELSINSEEVWTLISQAVWQVGTRGKQGNPLRLAHSIMSDNEFVDRLLQRIIAIVDIIEGNWKEEFCMSVLVLLVTRILSLSTDEIIRDRALNTLCRVRRIIIQWARLSATLAFEDFQDDNTSKTRQRTLRISLLCRMTYDLDDSALRMTLGDFENLALLTEVMILIHDHRPSCWMEECSNRLPRRVYFDLRLAHRLEPFVFEAALKYPEAVDMGIKRIWPEYMANARWVAFNSNSQWLMNATKSTSKTLSQQVLLDIIHGELLVEGKPVGRLPQLFVAHRSYQTLFGRRILHVVASNMPEMIYMTAKPLHGCQFYFGSGERDGEIVIRVRENARVYEIVPREHFGHDLPSLLINDYVHWMDITTGDIEFRLTDSVFQRSSNSWILSYSPVSSRMKRLGKSLVDLNSTTGREVSSIFSAFEEAHYLHITVDEMGLGEVYLPRFGLSFFVNNNLELESLDLSAVIDSDQSVGSLVGLRNRLVVRGKSSHGAFPERSVIVSLGRTSITRAGDHVKITLLLEGMRKVRYFRYHIDPILGHLRASADLLSRLFKVYLHALSSFVLPDPLTGKTGTEEALYYLREQAVQPLYPLDEPALSLLREIGHLTPQRVFYPKGKKRMQSVRWNTQLSPLSQHDQFHALVNRIIKHSNSITAFYSDGHANELRIQPLIERGDQELLERADIQNAIYWNYELGGALASRDKWYNARDSTNWSVQSRKAYHTAYLTRMWSVNMDVTLDLRSYFNVEEVNGAGEPLDDALLSAVLGISLPRNWGPVYEFCRKHHDDTERYKLQFFLATVAFAHLDSNLRPFHVLLACSISAKLREEELPPHLNYFPNQGIVPIKDSLLDAVRSTLVGCLGKKWKRPRSEWKAQTDVQIGAFVDTIIETWPSVNAYVPTDQCLWPLVNTVQANEACKRLFQVYHKNGDFFRHLDRITAGLSDFKTDSRVPILSQLITTNLEFKNTVPRARIAPKLTEIFGIAPFNPPVAPLAPEVLVPTRGYDLLTIVEKIELNGIATRFSRSDNAIERKYGQDLCMSLQSLCDVRFDSNPKSIPLTIDNLVSYRGACLDYVSDLIVGMQISCGLNSASMEHLRLGGLLPRFTTKTLLALIATTATKIDRHWKHSIINYGIALTMLQRAERMVQLVLKRDVNGFYQEVRNHGHNEWNVTEWPDWLLMEIEGNFLIRPIQAQVAFKMMAPSGGNTVMQLNMGEGKSSVIIPLVAAAVADGRSLARVIVLKPLVRSMAAVLSARLGGLLNRRIYFTPFSRQSRLDNISISNLDRIWSECRESRGVLIAQPEHILSFKLIGLERLSINSTDDAAKLIDMQLRLQGMVRNIIDESDEVMDPKEQLIYTIGLQQSFDGGPDRWKVIQSLLGLVNHHMRSRHDAHFRHEGGFPMFQASDEVVGELIYLLRDDIRNGHLTQIRLDRCGDALKEATLRFVFNKELHGADKDLVEKSFSGDDLNQVLVLRGLIGCGVLAHSFSKRWSVDFGLTDRIPNCLVAVPYRAKGCPSRAAEYGHADVMILLTCISYYNAGLTEKQLRTCFNMLAKSADPSLEYLTWSRGCLCLPPSFLSLRGVNLDDNHQFIQDLFPHLRYNKTVIDFYLSNVVFPIHCKEFPKKLSTSAWDIPAETGCPPTTGFSGTNDSKYLLPLSIDQEDLLSLQHTNAMVLAYLLQKRNRGYLCPSISGIRQTVQDLISVISTQVPAIRVLIDVGAQVLELGNKEVATAWLQLQPDADAAVYFSGSDEVMVITREGLPEPLVTSRFQDNLCRCLVYLDQSHTRGVDLRFAKTARAAVMLGQGLSKDRLVQGVMRMRQLNLRQSVLFFAPPEIDREIRLLSGKSADKGLDSKDVIRWTLENTMNAMKRNQPLWVLQGLSHSKRRLSQQAFLKNGVCGALGDNDCISEYLRNIEENDVQSLRSMYLREPEELSSNFRVHSADKVVAKLLEVGRAIGLDSLKFSAVGEEQERELAHEIEQELQVERPRKVSPARHRLHKIVRSFVQYGNISSLVHSDAFIPAFQVLRESSASSRIPDSLLHKWLFVTQDFATTVKLESAGKMDDYLRPVNFILSLKKTASDTLVIISPWEANELMDDIHDSEFVSLHLYAPKIARLGIFLDDLEFYTIRGKNRDSSKIPRIPRELNIFSGQLYLKDNEEYDWLLSFLAVRPGYKNGESATCSRGRGDPAGEESSTDLEVVDTGNPQREFLKAIATIRRKGQDFSRTHVGRILNGEKLDPDAFEF